jgi:hypothetical protein
VRIVTANTRKKLTTFLVVLYAFCVLAPHVAMAFAHGPDAAHCLTDSANSPHQHAAASAHAHDDGTMHVHDGAKAQEPAKGDDSGTQAGCCGLFFMSALAADSVPVLSAREAGKAVFSFALNGLTDHPPGRINEPPIA